MKKKIITKSAKQTQKLGKELAQQIFLEKDKENKKSATVLGLEGNLGGGKTTFLQGFADGLGIKEKILSPTFAVAKRFKVKGKHFENFYHIDCYRINNIKDMKSLGFRDIILNPKNIVAIEWAEIVKKNLPKSTIIIKFVFVDKNKRGIIIGF